MNWPGLAFPKEMVSIACEDGGDDDIYAGLGLVDYVVGGAFSDTIWGNSSTSNGTDGIDVVFGDMALIEFSDPGESGVLPFTLSYASTINASCANGPDFIYLSDGDDLAFGGGDADVIREYRHCSRRVEYKVSVSDSNPCFLLFFSFKMAMPDRYVGTVACNLLVD